MSKKLLPLFLLFVTVVIATGCSRRAVNDPYGLAAPLDSLIEPNFPDDAPGAVVMVCLGDSVLYQRSFGLARLDSVCPITENTLMNVASSTKTVTAAALLKLAEQGKLSLDDKLISYFPSFPEELLKNVTLRDVLSHTTGIPDLRPRNREQWDEYMRDNTSVFGLESDYCLYAQEKELTSYIEKLDTLAFPTRSKFDRQDPPFILLSRVIEKASGVPFEQWMNDNLFAPVGVHSARFVSPSVTSDMAHGYTRATTDSKPGSFRSANGRWDEFDYGEASFFLTRADRGLYISAKDFAKWQQALFSGKILSDSSIMLLREPVISSERFGEGASLGTNVIFDLEGRLKLYHRSTRGGFSALEAIFPDKKVMYLVFSNRNDWDSANMMDEIERILKSKGLI